MDHDHSKFADPEEIISCPYEEVHQVTRKRMATHLTKCRLQHLELSKKMLTCPFNFAHKIAAPELEIHQSMCTDRETYFTHQFQVPNSGSEAVEELYKNTEVKFDVPSSENWDLDDDSSNVLHVIEKNRESRGILKNHQNMPPAERKARREEDRQRMLARMNAEDEAKNKQSEKLKLSAWPALGGREVRSSAPVAQNSSACSVMSDSSFSTALDTTTSRLQEFTMVQKKPRGRAARVAAAAEAATPSPPSSVAGVGRGRLRVKREEA